MARRHYVNNAPQRTLASPITSGSTSLTVSGTFSGWPILFPFYATLDLGQAAEEIILVTNIVGSVATISRGQDGTAAVSHTSGATLDFSVGAADFDEANAHVNANTGVHGVSGSVVGTSDNQTLTNKTLTNPTINGANVSGTFAGTIGASGLTFTSPNLTTPSITRASVTGDATHEALTLQAGATNTALAVLKDNTGTQIGSLDAVAGLTVPKATAVIAPKQFTNEAAATAASVNVTGNIVWLTTPTTAGASAGPFQYNGSAWIPMRAETPRIQWSYEKTAAVSLTTGAFTKITLDTLVYDRTSVGFTSNQFTVPAGQGGPYLVSGGASVASNATGRRGVQVFKNGSGVDGTETLVPANASGITVVSTSAMVINLAAADVIDLRAFQDSGGALNSGTCALTVVQL